MTPDRWKEVKEILSTAIELEVSRREAYVREASMGDQKLLDEVMSLLEHSSAVLPIPVPPENLLEVLRCRLSSSLKGAPLIASEASPDERIGQTVGVWRLVQVLGTGGMGVVYLAEQDQPIRRRVALKLIKVGMDTRQVVARFEAERQALALMEHPHIASVIDAGATQDGRPFFVMEYVPGMPITEYCNRQRLSTHERLELFRQVCSAVQHAHQKGVIHRDVKPSNVLVMELDGRPVPKVIDFGIAKATQQQLTEHSFVTEQGLFYGTPEYMSPEQADATGPDQDARTDIYSLGVLLYMLLVDAVPFDAGRLRSVGYDEMRRIIREEEPQRPSTKLSSRGDTAASEVALSRCTTLPTLRRQLRGDLDWITLKALEKDRARRYASASELADDIRRYFRDEPVMARPRSLAYRSRKFVRKHRAPVAAAAAILLTLSIGLVVSFTLYLRADRSLHEANVQRRVAQDQRSAAVSNANAALARQLIAKAQLLHEETVDIEPSTLLAIESLQRLPLLDSDRELRLDMARLPRLNRSFPTDGLRYGDYPFALSSDARWVATTDKDGIARVFEVSSGKQVSRLAKDVRAITFSPDGRRIATGNGDATARVFDFRSAKEILRLPHEGSVIAVAFSPDGRWLATGNDSGSVRTFDASNGKEAWHSSSREGIRTVAFSADGRRVAVRTDHAVRISEAAGGRDVWAREWKGYPEDSVNALSLSPNGLFVAVAAGSAGYVFDVRNGKEIYHVEGGDLSRGEWRVDALAFSPDGEQVAWASTCCIGVFRVFIGQELWRSPQLSGVYAVAYSPDGRWVASGGGDGTARVFEANSGIEISRVTVAHSVNQVVFGRNGWVAAQNSFSPDELVRVFGPVGKEEGSVLPGEAYAVAFSPNGKLVATVEGAGPVRVFETGSGKELPLSQRGSDAVAFSPDGLLVATGSDQTARVFEVTSGKEVWHLDLPDRFHAVTFSPDGRWLAMGSGSGSSPNTAVFPTIRVLDAANGKELWRWKQKGEVIANIHALTFSSTGRKLAVAVEDGTTLVFEADSGKELFRLNAPQGAFAVAFSPDEQQLAVGSYDGTVQVSALKTGNELTRVPLREEVDFLSFAADGSNLIVGTSNAGHVINVPTGQETIRIETGGHVRAALLVDGQRYLELASAPLPGKEVRITRHVLRSQDLIEEACARLTRNLTAQEWKDFFGPEIPYHRTCSNFPLLQ